MMRAAALSSALLLLVVSPARPQGTPETRCSYSRRVLCDAKGCRHLVAGDAFLLVPTYPEHTFPGDSEPQIRMCDSAGCEPLDVVVDAMGDPLRMGSLSAGYLLMIMRSKIDTVTWRHFRGRGVDAVKLEAAQPGDFLEVKVDLAGAVFLGRGSCRGVVLPPRP